MTTVSTGEDASPLQLTLHEPDTPLRAAVENFIHRRFLEVHSADVRDFLPTLVSYRNARGQLLAAAGIKRAHQGPLFLEAYLDQPVEVCLSFLSGTPVARDRIVEVGNLATHGAGSTRQLIRALAARFEHEGLEWAVLTLTPTLINSFTRLGLNLHTLTFASPERVAQSASRWGEYYRLNPRVVAVSIPESAARLRQLITGECPTRHAASATAGERLHA
ncbi:thermostable hemolysin [Marinobacterium sp. AK62]|uniref:Thermostable hemolysin n=1 Tax=Marinobacterium alkalitolerans TaxID=1542925 RepID=A0ABS3Z7K5_9GAMM|nr:thermostable hemolysin [Marinobacterium alkalitolerans]MBP0047692.1 thermostable hemolysin [Marinobacterium alkalitolerans]